MKEIPASRESLAAKVYEAIRNAIIRGDLTPGSLHSVQELAGRLNVSRTPVREALLKLADQGMVRFERNRGARILQTTIQDLEQIFTLRLLLEVPATYRATRRIGPAELKQLRVALDAFCSAIGHVSVHEHLELDARFHRIIMRAAGNQRLADIVDSLRDLQMIRGVSLAPKSRDLRDICQDHRRIYDEIAAGDASSAAAAMREHLALSSRLLIAQETGAVDAAKTFESAWIDLLDLERMPKRSGRGKPPPATAGLTLKGAAESRGRN